MTDRRKSRLPDVNELLRGTAVPGGEVVSVRAGALSGEIVGGALRYLRFGETEIVRRIMVAVRDAAWNTVPAEIEDLSVQEADSSFAVTFGARNISADVDFCWRGRIAGSAEGSCQFSMSGVAKSEFEFRRIGLCVLHPIAGFAGQPYTISTRESSSVGELPDLVAPPELVEGAFVPLVPGFELLTLASGATSVSFCFEGDLFELEDQRNWTDASFKTYSRFPAPGPLPERAHVGMAVNQGVSITTAGLVARRTRRRRRLQLVIGEELGCTLPPAGTAESVGERPSGEAMEKLHSLAPSHLRVDVHLGERWADQLKLAVLDARQLECPIELGVFLDEPGRGRLKLLADVLVDEPLARVLVYSEDSPSTTSTDVALAREVFSGFQVPIGAGTDLHFADLNQYRPDLDALDLVAFPITPQVHAGDESSMVETPEALGAVLRTAQSFCGDRNIVVSPITLRPRFNPDAVGDDGSAGPTPDNVDPRQASLFAAVWTLATMKALAEAGASSTTWFEMTGARGVVGSSASGSDAGPWPDLAYPVYHVIRDFVEHEQAPVLACSSTDPLAVAGLAVSSVDKTTLFVANLQPARRSVEVRVDLGQRFQQVSTRRMNTRTGRLAMIEPDRFRDDLSSCASESCHVVLELLPYEYSRLEFTRREHPTDGY